MPRYYFHLSNGEQVLNNHKGIDLTGNAAAREDAMALARDLKHGAAMPGLGRLVRHHCGPAWSQGRRGADRGCLSMQWCAARPRRRGDWKSCLTVVLASHRTLRFSADVLPLFSSYSTVCPSLRCLGTDAVPRRYRTAPDVFHRHRHQPGR